MDAINHQHIRMVYDIALLTPKAILIQPIASSKENNFQMRIHW